MTSAESAPRPSRDRDRDRDRGERGRGGPRRGRQKVCMFCEEKIKRVDYKDLPKLRPMVTEHGKIKSRRLTGTCARHQRGVAEAVKRARQMAMLPFVAG